METSPSPAETVEIGRLFCSPTNPRLNDQAVPHVASSLRRFGWQQPIVAKRSGEVIAGNTRLKAALELGMDEVPVWWFDGSDLDAVAYNLADNRSSEHSQWNDPELAKLLEHLRAEDALDGIGYDEDDIDALVAELRAQEEVDRDLDDALQHGSGATTAIAERLGEVDTQIATVAARQDEATTMLAAIDRGCIDEGTIDLPGAGLRRAEAAYDAGGIALDRWC